MTHNSPMPWAILSNQRKSVRNQQAALVAVTLAQATALRNRIDQIDLCLAEIEKDTDRSKKTTISSAANLDYRDKTRQQLLQDQKTLLQEEQRTLAELALQRSKLCKTQQEVQIVDHLEKNHLLTESRKQAAQEVRAADDLVSQRAHRIAQLRGSSPTAHLG
jgi:hypothetical protein